MSFYGRARPALRSAIYESTPGITRNSSSICSSNNYRVSGFGRFSLISSQIGQKADKKRRWFQNPRNVLIVVAVGSGVLITIYFGNLETIPYTNRNHFVLLSRSMERRIGESQFEQLKASFKGKILPAIHPERKRSCEVDC